jgi:hypothetical protein
MQQCQISILRLHKAAWRFYAFLTRHRQVPWPDLGSLGHACLLNQSCFGELFTRFSRRADRRMARPWAGWAR